MDRLGIKSLCVPEGLTAKCGTKQLNNFITLVILNHADYPNGHRKDFILTMKPNLKGACAGVMANHTSPFEINHLLKEIRNVNGVKISQ